MSTSEQSPPVQYKPLGKSGLCVSVPILGAMSLGTSQWGPHVLDMDESVEVLKQAFDRGITTFDTAGVYSNGESERAIGNFMKKYEIPRQNLVIMTKCFALVGNTPSSYDFADPGHKQKRDYVNQSGLSRAAIFSAVDASLARLGTSYIDIFILHRFDPTVPAEETMRALHDLVLCGKVRYLGASSMHTWQFAMLNHIAELKGWTKFVAMTDEHSLLYREEEREMFGYCAHNGIGIIPYAPLAVGALCRPFGIDTIRSNGIKGTSFEPKFSAADEEIIARVGELAKKKEWTMARVAMAWSASKVTSPIVGISRHDRLEEAIVGCRSTLTEEEAKYLEEPYVARSIKGYF